MWVDPAAQPAGLFDGVKAGSFIVCRNADAFKTCLRHVLRLNSNEYSLAVQPGCRLVDMKVHRIPTPDMDMPGVEMNAPF